MDSFFVRYKNSLVLALVLVAQFCLLAVQVKPRLPGAAVADQAGVRVLRAGVTTVVAPPEKVLHASGLSLRGIWSSYIDLMNVKQQNDALQAENQRLQLEQAALAEDARQGERLQELLAFKQHYVDTTVPAQVVGTGGSDHSRILYIDKGSEDGIAVEMPVITPDGIVGKIREVLPHTSQVLEISDPTSAAGVLLEQTRTRGILRGDNVGHAQIVNLMPDDRIKPGQLVLTSGGDQIYPRGLPVGIVDRVVPDIDNQPLVDVILKPAANLGRLEEVLVVTGTAASPSGRSRQDLARSLDTAAAVKAAATAKAEAAQKAEAALEAQRASDILAQRLPSAANVENPDAPDAAPGSSPATADSDAAPLHPPSPLHADHYSPGAVPAATNLTPGERLAPYAEGIPDTDRAVKTDGDPAASLPNPSVSPAFRAAHDAAVAARPHPATPLAAAPTAAIGTAAGTAAAAVPAADGTVLKPLFRRIPQLNPDGTPLLNADGTPAVKRVAVLNPDGTPVMHRVPVVPAGGTPAAPRTPVRNADGTLAAVPVRRSTPALNADGTPASPHVVRAPALNADGTPATTPVRRVPAAQTGAGTGTARPAAAPGASGTKIPGGTAAGTAAAGGARTAAGRNTGAASSAGRPAAGAVAPRASVPTRVIEDGPIPAHRPATTRPPAGGTQLAAPHRRALVPDDGSRPPAPKTAPQATPGPTTQQANPQGAQQ